MAPLKRNPLLGSVSAKAGDDSGKVGVTYSDDELARRIGLLQIWQEDFTLSIYLQRYLDKLKMAIMLQSSERMLVLMTLHEIEEFERIEYDYRHDCGIFRAWR